MNIDVYLLLIFFRMACIKTLCKYVMALSSNEKPNVIKLFFILNTYLLFIVKFCDVRIFFIFILSHESMNIILDISTLAPNPGEQKSKFVFAC